MTPTLATEVGFRPEVTPAPLPAAPQVEPFPLAPLPRLPRGLRRGGVSAGDTLTPFPFPGRGPTSRQTGAPQLLGPPDLRLRAKGGPKSGLGRTLTPAPPISSLPPCPELSHLLKVLGGLALPLALLGVEPGVHLAQR